MTSNISTFHSLRFRGLVAAALAVVLLSIAMITSTVHVLRAVAIDTIRTTIRQTSETLNLAISPSTTVAALPGLQDYFHELVSSTDDGIVYLILEDEAGKRLAASAAAPAATPPASDDIGSQIRTGIVHVGQPILIEGGGVGRLYYGLSSRQYQEAQSRLLADNLKVLVASVVVVTGLLLLLSYWFNQRMMRLMRASRELADGNYSVRAPDAGLDEFARLGTDFNLMATAVQDRMAALEQSRSEIVQLNASLEMRVGDRTSELAERNSELGMAIQNLHRTRESLVQSEKLASLGSLVAAIAHEMNTPIGNALTVATSFAAKTKAFSQAAQGELRRSVLDAYIADSGTAADLVERNLFRAAGLITSFKHVAVDQTSSKRRSFDLGSTLSDVVRTLMPSIAATKIVLSAEYPEGIVMDSFPGPIGQVVTNFVMNSLMHGYEAGESGCMSLRCRLIGSNEVELIFSDDGKGILPEHLGRVFEPFFTTRMGGGGSGLGLSIVYNIVTGLLGGTIEVHSKAGEQTTFRLLIPICAPDDSQRIAA